MLDPDDQSGVMITLRGSMDDIVRALATAIASGLVQSVAPVVPCKADMYRLCPLAALVDETHPNHVSRLGRVS